MRNFLKSVPDSLLRLSIVIASFFGIAMFLRFYLLPASLTDVELHKRSAVEREISKEITYAGSGLCPECHEEEGNLKRQGYHFNLSCEICHGPALQHTEDFEIKPAAPRGRQFCPVCHAFDPSRPTGFPQINPVAHNPLEACIKCHEPHDPRPLETPHECNACHAEIARTKAVSHHVLIECTTCHTVSEEHKLLPRVSRATKPTRRQFCGDCHGEDSEVQETPKVDMASHGNSYLCWQCHYPHLPEVR
jgi:hypothetical protein